MRYLVDLHTHTVASGHAYSTVLEIAAYAADYGLQMFACTDHGPTLPGGACPLHFNNLHVVPYVLHDVAMLHGIEANILPDGTIDLEQRILDRLDIVLAGFHGAAIRRSLEENTETLIKVIESGQVDIITHPDNKTYPLDYEAVVEAAARCNVALELNAASVIVRPGSEDNCRTFVKLAVQKKCPLSLGSDAHFASLVGKFESVLPILEECNVPPAQVINVSPLAVLDFLESRGHKPIGELREYFKRELSFS